MKIILITPAPSGSRKGNRVTAVRWARLLRELGHSVVIGVEYRGERCDVLIALHARRSFAAVERFSRDYPDKPLVLALTGTDLYGDIHTDDSARRALDMATRFVLLQPHGMNQLPPRLRDKARVIFQSVKPPSGVFRPKKDVFEVCVLGHMREVKDPFRTAQAARLLPDSSQVQVVHVGGALCSACSNNSFSWCTSPTSKYPG